jgi:tetratricopeptide (TPR) repeat protein
MDDRRAFSLAIYNIAQILAKRDDFERARTGFELSLYKSWEIGDRWAACLKVAGLAAVHERVGDVDGAEALYRQAIDLGRSLSIPSFLSGMRVGLARFLLEQGRAVEAGSVYEEALARISSVTSERLAGEDTRFNARVLGIHLRHVLGEWSSAEAAAEIHSIMKDGLLRDADDPDRQAALNYALWR